MSFYDSASLAFLPSGGAGKDGKAYSIKPVPEYGNELVTNGGFDTNSDWTFIGSANIANGVVNFITVGDFVVQNNVVSLSVETYKIQYEVVSSNNGQLRFAGGSSAFPVTTLPSSVGIHTVIVVSNGTQGSLQFNSNGFIGSIDNVSVKEVIVDGDFTFSRGSNLTATRVDSNGLIEKGRENLLLQSNQFDTTWITSNASVTSGQSGYDGSSDAWLLSKSAASGRIYQNASVSGVATYSVYAKRNDLDWLFIIGSAGSYPEAYFDLLNGTIGNTSSHQNFIGANIEDVGNGWYRCSITFNDSLTRLWIYPADGNNNFSGTSGSIYIQDSQVEIGLVATEYIESGATTGLAGLLEDSPRFDYSGGASCPSLLLEPSRTNLIDYSEYLQNALTQGQVDITFTPNYGTSPEGVKNSTRIQFADNSAYAYKAFTITADTTASMYVKGTSGETFRFGLADNAGAGGLLHTFSGEWERISNTRNTNAQLVFSSYGGTALDFEAYGLQVEEGSYPTSYIPNHSGGSVTRELDHCFTSSNSVLEEINATYFLEVTPIQIASNNLLEVRANGSTNNRILLQTNSSGVLRVLVRAQGSSVLDQNISGAVSVNTKVKIALKYTDQTNISVFVDGVKEIDSDLVIDFSPELNGLDLEGSSTANYDSLKQHQFIFFPTALSNTDLEILTGTSYESFAAMATALNYTTYE